MSREDSQAERAHSSSLRFCVHSDLGGWDEPRRPTLERPLSFTQAAGSNVPLTQKHSCLTQGLGTHGPVKLTPEINPHRGTERAESPEQQGEESLEEKEIQTTGRGISAGTEQYGG